MNSVSMTGGDAIVAGLKRWGVDTLFGLPGIQLDGLFDALQRDGSLRVLHTRHEQGTAYMAFGYAQVTGRPGVCAVVPGPGLLNAAAAAFHPGFLGAITLSQGLVTLCLMASSVLLFLIGRSLAFTGGSLAAALVLFALSGPAIAETANGMEMALLTAAGLALIYTVYFRPSRLGAILATLVFLSTRFEAIFFFGLLIAPLLFERRLRTALLLAGSAALAEAESTEAQVIPLAADSAWTADAVYAGLDRFNFLKF